jgi:hypothetical protein
MDAWLQNSYKKQYVEDLAKYKDDIKGKYEIQIAPDPSCYYIKFKTLVFSAISIS